MASDLFVFDNMTFFSDPFSPFSDSSSADLLHDLLSQTFEDNNLNNHNNNDKNSNSIVQENSGDETTYSLHQIATALFSSSPPSHQLQNLSICQTAQNNNYSHLDVVKTEEYQVPAELEANCGFNNSFLPQNNSADNVVNKLMQRSYSSNSFDGKPNFFFHPKFDGLMESPNLQSSAMNPPENNFSSGQMRRVCSTGDLQVKNNPAKSILSTSPLSTEGSFMEEANFKVGRYSAEERKERIHRYRAKRTQRNFNKTIKYACRKTLADNRPRIRGRFARNDEAVEIPKASIMFNTSSRYEDEDDLWIEGFHEEEGGSAIGTSSRAFYNNFGSAAQYQYYSY